MYRLILFSLALFFTANASSFSIYEITSLNPDELNKSFDFSDDAQGTIEKRLKTINQDIEDSGCLAIPLEEIQNESCLFPYFYKEFIETGKILSENSFDASQLTLTLASRMHPVNFLDYSKTNKRFDTLYARFLISQRMMREIVQSGYKESFYGSDQVMSWLAAQTPSSFLLNLSRRFNCLGPLSECGKKKIIIGAFQHLNTVLQEDEAFIPQIQATIEATRPTLHTERDNTLLKSIVDTMTDKTPGNILLFSLNSGVTPFDIESAKEYLQNVSSDSERILIQNGSFTGQACHDIAQTLTLSKKENLSWASSISGEFDCQENNGKLYTISGEAFDTMEKNHLQWRFNFYQLRLMIIKLFDAIEDVDPIELKKAQIHEALKDFEEVRTHMTQYPHQKLDESHLKLMRPFMGFTYNNMLDNLDQALQLQ